MKCLPLKKFSAPDVNFHIPPDKEFTIAIWTTFVRNNEHLLHYDGSPLRLTANSLNASYHDTLKIINPLKSLTNKMTLENIQQELSLEFSDLLQHTTTSPNFTYTSFDNTYQLISGLLYIERKQGLKILLPKSLEGLFIAFSHLSSAHGGVARMTAILHPYYFLNKYDKIRHLAARCYSCSLVNKTNRKEILGTYPIPTHMMETICLDLMESLNTQEGYSHILVIVCALTKFVFAFPLKDKTSLISYNTVYFRFFGSVFFLPTTTQHSYTNLSLPSYKFGMYAALY